MINFGDTEMTDTPVETLEPQDSTGFAAPLQEAPTHTPADMAAMFFSMNEKKLQVALGQLSIRQARRIIYNLASYPLGKSSNYALKTDAEKSVVYITNEMLNNKQVMAMAIQLEAAQSKEASEQIAKAREVDAEIVSE